ncbi:MAG: ketol-acid reductoisomerase [Verrucomicrobiota bacterium]|jgi:ketol-acid reductoisomerase|nr:ketol-acid reductoisomerase [Opitutae bacterium]MBO25629.1 ketol-acid reductoisomerase [Opitutales bacterium]MEC7627538.1 ketol-acid reductoisomerase [Verrucomicrobiota bacterium]MEC8657555.1 ketol-acid reductoisomerase [Verrucomicrobiota bacterium]MEC8789909.1 ketol-acid reductoisomerase [Verrucomicrobiota bacterium]|tara:strand:+ start:2876 stop:3904 length:1029 start_codon:yes stop_codon:yes gene_type:complete
MPAKVYTQKEAKITPIKKKTLAVIGYGSQGHAHALNLKESGCKVIIGLYKGSKSIRVAKRHGFEVTEVAEAVQKADVIMIGVPDMKQAEVYENEIKPNLSKGKTLLFTHGFAIHFGLIKPPRGVSVIMVAPKGPGHVVRSQFKEGKGVPALIAVLKGSSKDSKKIALAWAAGVGAARSGILETSFKEETETDLFGEQAVLCGGASALVQAGFDTLVEAGYAPEMAYFECLHELKLIVDLMIESGVAGMRFSVSETAKYGDVTRGSRVINGNVKKSMKSILKEIQSGKFAKEWVKEYEAGLPKYNQLLEEGERHPIEITGQRLRSLMPWIPKKNIKGAQASYS